MPYTVFVGRPLGWLAHRLAGLFDAGERRHAVLAWLTGVGGLTLLTAAIHAALQAFNPLLGWLWTVLVLYLTMGFRQFSHHFTDIQMALRMDDLPHARVLLAQWTGCRAGSLSAAQVARLAIVQVLMASHRHVFGVLGCFVLLPGPCGAVFYRAAAFFAERWASGDDAESGVFGDFSERAFALIDWLPLRLSAASFAIVGNFEDAVYCWRTRSGKRAGVPPGRGVGLVVASGMGALGMRAALDEPEDDIARAGAEDADDSAVDAMQSAVALVWRALLLWLLLLLLVGLSRLIA